MKHFKSGTSLRIEYINTAKTKIDRVLSHYHFPGRENNEEWEMKALKHEISRVINDICEEYEMRAPFLVLAGAMYGALAVGACVLLVSIFNI